MQWLNVEDSVFWDVMLWWLINILPLFCRTVSLKHQKLLTCWHRKAPQKTWIFINTTVRTSNLTWINVIFLLSGLTIFIEDLHANFEYNLKKITAVYFMTVGFKKENSFHWVFWVGFFFCLFVSSCFKTTSHYQSSTTI